MVAITINNKVCEAGEGETILQVLQRERIHVPTLCHLAHLTPSGACRMCVVEVEGYRNLVPSCSQPVAPNMVIRTHSPRALNARKTIVELLLANHPDDCLYCERSENCELQSLAKEFRIRNRRFDGARMHHKMDLSSASIIRDPDKCILCGKCVRVCEEVMGVGAIDFSRRGSESLISTCFDVGLNRSSCVNCGQCIMVCPTGALREQPHIKQISDAINDPERVVVVQHAPAVSVTIAEELGLEPGLDVCGLLTSGLRALGFDRVFDTSWSADLTIMEEASELVHRIQNGGVLPMMTSCSPGWIKFVEQFYPDFIPNLSSCKSPQQMLGAVIKNYWAKRNGIDPRRIYSVSVMPCTAKKYECSREEHLTDGIPDIDAVLTVRELSRFIRMSGLNIETLTESQADLPFGERSSAGKLFGATGGVMEAAVRTAFHMVTGEELGELKLEALRGLDSVKEARLNIGGLELGIAVVSGLANARKLLEELRKGRKDLHFIEVMTCPGGCIGGGGQPFGADEQAIKHRMKALYAVDELATVRVSHENPAVRALYQDYLEHPLSERSHRLLHTTYQRKDNLL